MTLATNLDEVYRACDPDKPLSALDERYVDLAEVRGTKVIATTIARRIERCNDGQFYQQLFTGHRGSGKSTELLRLKKELQSRNFFAIYIDVEELLDLADLDYLDVLLSIAKQTEEELRKSDIALNDELLENLGKWFEEKIIENGQSNELSAGLKTQIEAEAKIPFFAKLMASLTAEIKTASSRRITTRQKLEREQAVFIERLNFLLLDARSKVQKRGHKDIVLIVDGLEKIHYRILDDKQSSHAHLFVVHAEQLKAPRCHIVYTMPISLAFNANLGNDFDDVQLLPMVKMNDQGIACLGEVVARRVDVAATFEQTNVINELAQLSGGVMRDLMRLIRLSTDTDEAKIGASEIEYAKKALIREYDRLLRDDEFEKLAWVRANRRVTGDESYARLLNLRLILEYQNGGRWADVHPAVMQIPWVEKRLQNETSE
ncbi:MAG: AAA family ATPase [Candidatus Thiothrix sulfatifontis]|nr:MAG: AAA family ATPase [Candidatus Thiothrix sulfatifontis]